MKIAADTHSGKGNNKVEGERLAGFVLSEAVSACVVGEKAITAWGKWWKLGGERNIARLFSVKRAQQQHQQHSIAYSQ